MFDSELGISTCTLAEHALDAASDTSITWAPRASAMVEVEMAPASQPSAALGRSSLLPPCNATFVSLIGAVEDWIQASEISKDFAVIRAFCDVKLKFLPDSREIREVRERRSSGSSPYETRPGPPRLA